MDLSIIQDALSTFSTFAGNIGNFLKLPIELLNSLLGNDFGADVDETTGAIEGLSSTPETEAPEAEAPETEAPEAGDDANAEAQS